MGQVGSAYEGYAGWLLDAGCRFPRRYNPDAGRSAVDGVDGGLAGDERGVPRWLLLRCDG